MIQVNRTKFQQRAGQPRVYTVEWAADTEQEAETGVPQLFRGLPLVDMAAVQWHPGSLRYLVAASYEGLLEDPSPDQDQFTIDGEFREEKIESFPNRKLLVEAYGAREIAGRLEFPRLLPRQAQGSTGLPRQDRDREEENPLWNVRTYPVFYETAVWSFVRQRVPSFVNRIAGQVLDQLPSGFEYDGEATQWFVPKAPRMKRGGAWSIAIHYKEIDEFRHLAALQALISGQAGPQGGLSTGTLSTGSL